MDGPRKRYAEWKGSDARYVIPCIANIQNKQSQRREVDEWFPDSGPGQGETGVTANGPEVSF